MTKQTQALEILEKIKQNCPTKFFDEIEISQKGAGFVLMHLAENLGNGYANSMAETLGVSRARMAVVLSKLEKRGLVKRTPSNTDGRIDIIEITDLGYQYVEDMKAEALQKTMEIIDAIGFQEVKNFVDISIKIKHILGC